jgi:hypothetical protein
MTTTAAYKKRAVGRLFSRGRLATWIFVLALGLISYRVAAWAMREYSDPDFGKTFGQKAIAAKNHLLQLREGFDLCSKVCTKSPVFMQSMVFPELMRYNSLKDDIERESLYTLYVQLGERYANFSIGLFQMKPSFALQVEQKAKALLPDSVYRELQLTYSDTEAKAIRRERVNRLSDSDWQLIYLTAFICCCDALYKDRNFAGEKERMQWYATVYNAGFDQPDATIQRTIRRENFYLEQEMPGKKFRYAAIAGWYYTSATDRP